MANSKLFFLCGSDSKHLYPTLYGQDGTHPSASGNGLESNDYLSDALFHYFKTNESFDVWEFPWRVHMYKDSPSVKMLTSGKGFGLKKDISLPPNILSFEQARAMISDKFFDFIVTDARTLNRWWFERGLSPFYDEAYSLFSLISKIYPANQIVFLDGDDQTTILREFVSCTTYYKRELNHLDSHIHPISYCFPASKFRSSKLQSKEKLMATVIPGYKSTYQFDEEVEYYSDMQKSMYGLSWKKLGWDCFRHYEIIFSSCLIIFPDISECPSMTMVNFPKSLCSQILNTGILQAAKRFQMAHDLYGFKDILMHPPSIGDRLYEELLEQQTEHALAQLTTEATASYVLNRAELCRTISNK